MSKFDKLPRELESGLQAEIIDYGEMRGWFIVKITSPSRNGMPDVYAVRRGRHVWIEVKRQDEAARAQQLRVKRLLEEHGAEVFVVDCIEDARAILK